MLPGMGAPPRRNAPAVLEPLEWPATPAPAPSERHEISAKHRMPRPEPVCDAARLLFSFYPSILWTREHSSQNGVKETIFLLSTVYDLRF